MKIPMALRAKAILVGGFVPPILAAALAGLAALGPAIFVGPNGNGQIAPYQFLNTLSFNTAIVFGLIGAAVAVNLRSHLQLPWLLAGETAAVVAVGAAVPGGVWQIVAGLPAPCAGQVGQISLASGVNPFWLVPTIASILLGTFGGRETAGVGRLVVFVATAFVGLFGVFTLFSTIDNAVVEPLFFHC
ncbi:MAG TPA: hypothetical protein VFY29_08595 [Terriglobia bacterium]|nr:hypothetical protein [Terriglobia bacterium]